MRYLEQNMLIFFLCISLFFEGIGIPFGRESTYFLILIMPLLLFTRSILLKHKIVVPKNISYFFLLFLIFSSLATIFSLNIQKSFEYLIYLIALYLIFIYAYNYKALIEKKLTTLIFLLSTLFVLYSIILSLNLFPFLTPLTGYQFVFSPKLIFHNHLGDFLTLPIIICFYYLFRRKWIFVSLLFVFYSLPFVVFSYSRSAYFSITLTVVSLYHFLIAKNKSWKHKLIFQILISGIVLLTLFLSLATTLQTKEHTILSSINKFLIEKEGLSKNKDISGNRFNYLIQGTLSITNRPLFGVGPYNFEYISNEFSNNPMYGTTFTAHNIFLEIASEHGLLAFITFAVFIILLFAKSKKNVLYFVLLVMFINFQTDYTYRIYSFFLLFFVIAGTIYAEKNEKGINIKMLLVTSIFLSLFAFIILLSNILQLNNHSREAFLIYPINERVYVPLINQQLNAKNNKNAIILSGIYESLFSGDYLAYENLGHIYEDISDKKKALYYYEKSLSKNYFRTPYLIEKVYTLKKETQGEKNANSFILNTFTKLNKLEHPWYVPEEFIKILYKTCSGSSIKKCPSLSL